MVYDYIIYTDGGCRVNPGGAGAYAAVVLDGNTNQVLHQLCGDEPSTTNNRMELMAAIIGLQVVPNNSSLLIYSDSQYLIKTMEGYYQRKKNLDLWEILDELVEDKEITWNWVRGHDGNQYNEMCDEMCTKAQDKYYGTTSGIYEDKILEYLKENERISNIKVRELLNVEAGKATKILSTMVQKNKIQRCGTGIKTHYILKNEMEVGTYKSSC